MMIKPVRRGALEHDVGHLEGSSFTALNRLRLAALAMAGCLHDVCSVFGDRMVSGVPGPSRTSTSRSR